LLLPAPRGKKGKGGLEHLNMPMCAERGGGKQKKKKERGGHNAVPALRPSAMPEWRKGVRCLPMRRGKGKEREKGVLACVSVFASERKGGGERENVFCRVTQGKNSNDHFNPIEKKERERKGGQTYLHFDEAREKEKKVRAPSNLRERKTEIRALFIGKKKEKPEWKCPQCRRKGLVGGTKKRSLWIEPS